MNVSGKLVRGKSSTSTRTLGEFEYWLLHSVEILGRDAYGARLERHLGSLLKRPISLAQIYVSLDRLERKGFVKSELSDPEPVRGGRAKRVYNIEAPGWRALRAYSTIYASVSEVKDAMDETSEGIPQTA